MPPKRKTKTQAIKKPLAETQNHDDNPHDEAEEIVEDPKDIEIAKLQEEIRLLKIENDSLRKNTEEKNLVEHASTPKARHATVTITPAKPRRNSIQSMKLREKGCSCSGNCANKKCGCVKKDMICSEFCKCADTCQNQMANVDENKENEDMENIPETKITQKNNNSKHRVAKTKLNATSIEFSDNTSIQTEISNNDENNKNKDENNMLRTKITQRNDISKCRAAKTEISTSSSESSGNASIETEEEEGINPMEPRRQLPRSPLHQPKISPNSTANTTVFNDDDVFLPVPKEEVEDELPPPEEIYQAHVDWEEHQKKLVKCSKCKRTFHEYRLKKHEKSCLQI